MKKLLLTLSLAAIATLSQAQGYIEFYGGSANITTNGATQGKIGAYSTGNVYDFALLYETTTLTGNSAPTNSAWSLVQAFGNTSLAYATNGLGPGDLYGPGSSGGVETALTAGTAYSVELVGWSANISYATVLADISAGFTGGANTVIGWTTVGTITPTGTPTGAPTVFPSTFSNGSLVLNQVSVAPEPTTVALAGLGGLALLGLRRKK